MRAPSPRARAPATTTTTTTTARRGRRTIARSTDRASRVLARRRARRASRIGARSTLVDERPRPRARRPSERDRDRGAQGVGGVSLHCSSASLTRHRDLGPTRLPLFSKTEIAVAPCDVAAAADRPQARGRLRRLPADRRKNRERRRRPPDVPRAREGVGGKCARRVRVAARRPGARRPAGCGCP